MKKTLTLLLSLLLGSLAFASGDPPPGVPDGSTWTSPAGDTVTVNVDMNPTVNTVTVSVTHGNHSSNPVTGDPGFGSSVNDPTCSGSPAMSVLGAGSYRCHNRRLQRAVTRSDGTSYWANMRRVRDPQRTSGGDPQQRGSVPGDEVTSLPE